MQKYCKESVERVRGCEPKHPHFCRTYEKDGELVPQQSYDDTPMDIVYDVEAPTVAEQLRAGEMPEKLGAVPSLNGLSASEVASRFLDMFRAAGRVSVPAAAPAAPAAPSVESSKTE